MKAKQQGWDDFFAAQDVNPHPAGSTKRTYWKQGWEAAKLHWNLPLRLRSGSIPQGPVVIDETTPYRHPIRDVN